MTELTMNQGFASQSKAIPRRRKSGFPQEVNAVATIVARGILLTLKSPGALIMSLVMPVIMMGMIGGNLSQNMAGGLGYDYGQFMLVGMLVNMLFMTTSQGLSSLVEDRETNFTQEMLIAPVSRYSIVIGTILGSAFTAILSCTGTLAVGLLMGISIGAGQLLAILALSPLMCLAAGAFGMLIIGVVKNKRAVNMAIMLIPMSQMFLSGAIIPINASSGVLLVLSRLMPMTYCLDLVRAVVYAGTPEYGAVVMFNPAITFAAILSLTAVFLTVGTWLFARSETHK
ncbi:MAG: ABC transporter permease [Gracilibacteraceae bacterium]|jgi:ABC-2 type transport system permease protein|nr:ABC transporter permease [Gracilibacteraceae bacterium]